MNVTKCMNGHFYDADKYDLCPHCGAVSIVKNPGESASQDAKKSGGFWGKKKLEKKENNVVEVPDKTIGKTFGVFSDDIGNEEQLNLQNADNGKTVKNESSDTPAGGIIMCTICRQAHHYNSPCPKESFNKECNIGVEEAGIEEKNEANINKTPESVVSGSLHYAVKKASASSEGKTVGFFSSGGSSNETEPVVGWLVCIKGKHFGESFNISSGRNAIGRNKSNKIILTNDDTVSREKHAWLTYEPKKREFFVQPGDGSGLTYLNGDNVMESKKLQTDDILEFGDGQYIFVPLCGENFTWENYLGKE